MASAILKYTRSSPPTEVESTDMSEGFSTGSQQTFACKSIKRQGEKPGEMKRS